MRRYLRIHRIRTECCAVAAVGALARLTLHQRLNSYSNIWYVFDLRILPAMVTNLSSRGRLHSMEKFRNGEIDIDDLCSELRAKAKCSEGGGVVDRKDVDNILEGMIVRYSLEREGQSNTGESRMLYVRPQCKAGYSDPGVLMPKPTKRGLDIHAYKYCLLGTSPVDTTELKD